MSLVSTVSTFTEGFSSSIRNVLLKSERKIRKTLYAEFSHLIVLCIRCCVRATNTSVDNVDKHSIKCIVYFDLCIDSVDKQDTLLNTQ